MLIGTTEDVQTIISKGPALISQVAKIITKAGEQLPMVLDIVEDPALPQIAQRIKILKSLAATGSTRGATTSTSTYVPGTGIGLKRALPVLDALIFYLKNPWVAYAAGAGIVLVLGGIGFKLGQRSALRRAR